MSAECSANNGNLFKVAKVRFCVNLSQEDTSEEASERIISGTLKLETHFYTSIWVETTARYDVLPKELCLVAHYSRVDYI